MDSESRTKASSALRRELHSLHAEATPQGCKVLCSSLWLGNALRRGLLTAVPVLACTGVQILQNDSGYSDEQLAHRCGQLALQSDQTTASGVIEVTGRSVLGSDIRLQGARVAPHDETCVIAPLNHEQKLHAKLQCTRGRPLRHAKFQSVVAPGFWPEVRFTKSPNKMARALLKAAGYTVNSSNVVNSTRPGPVRREAVAEAGGRDLPDFCDFDRVVINVESLGQVPAIECVRIAIEGLLSDMDSVCSKLDLVSKCA